MWQFTPSTARAYGLKVDRQAGIDERVDLEKETDAAARLLADLSLEPSQLAVRRAHARGHATRESAGG